MDPIANMRDFGYRRRNQTASGHKATIAVVWSTPDVNNGNYHDHRQQQQQRCQCFDGRET